MSFGIGQPGQGMNGILAAATANALGGVRIGANVTVATDGTISVAAPGTGAPIASVFGRTGAVVAATGDYTFAQIAGALTAAQIAGAQTPWLQNVNAGGYSLTNLAQANATGYIQTPHVNATANLLIDTSGNAGDISFGANYVIMKAGGNVGIGTTTPATNLDVNGGIRAFGTLNTPTSGVGVELDYNPAISTGYVLCYDRTASAYKLLQIAGSVLSLNPTGGNVGIGTTAPAGTLHVIGNLVFAAGGTGNGQVFSSQAGYLNMRTGTTGLNIDNNAGSANLMSITNSGGISVTPGDVTQSVVMRAGWGSNNADALCTQTAQWYAWAANNTQLIFRMRGTDGVFRSATLTLA